MSYVWLQKLRIIVVLRRLCFLPLEKSKDNVSSYPPQHPSLFLCIYHQHMASLLSESVKVLAIQSCPTLCDTRDCSPPSSSCPRNSPGKNTGMGCHSLLQGIFLTQGQNPGLLHCRQIPYHLSQKATPILQDAEGSSLIFVFQRRRRKKGKMRASSQMTQLPSNECSHKSSQLLLFMSHYSPLPVGEMRKCNVQLATLLTPIKPLFH